VERKLTRQRISLKRKLTCARLEIYFGFVQKFIRICVPIGLFHHRTEFSENRTKLSNFRQTWHQISLIGKFDFHASAEMTSFFSHKQSGSCPDVKKWKPSSSHVARSKGEKYARYLEWKNYKRSKQILRKRIMLLANIYITGLRQIWEKIFRNVAWAWRRHGPIDGLSSGCVVSPLSSSLCRWQNVCVSGCFSYLPPSSVSWPACQVWSSSLRVLLSLGSGGLCVW